VFPDGEGLGPSHDRRECCLARIRVRAGERQRPRLDDDGGASAAGCDRLERRPGEREPERVSHGSGCVDDLRGRRRADDDVFVIDGDDDDARAREERYATHAVADDTGAGEPSRFRRNPPDP